MCNVYWIGDKNSIYSPSGNFIPFQIEMSHEIYPNKPAPIFKSMSIDYEVLTWGLSPPPKISRSITNVRNLHSYFWRDLLSSKNNRCLVPASRFAEWFGKKGEMQKAWFSLLENDFMFAGIFQNDRFAFLTTEPNDLIKPYHPKSMPVILSINNYEEWLEGNFETALKLQTQLPSELMKVLET